MCFCSYINKHLIKKHGIKVKIICTLNSISVCAVIPVAKSLWCGCRHFWL